MFVRKMKRLILIIPFFISFHCNVLEIEKPNLLQYLFVFSSPASVGVVTSDFSSGGRFKSFDLNSLTSSPTSATIHSDAIGRFFNQRVYIVNRLNRDTIQVLDPALAFLTVQDFSVGQGRNPHDISVWNDKYYIALYNSDAIPIYNANTGLLQGSISLSRFRETFSSSGNPDAFLEAESMVQHESKLFVTLQRLDRNDTSGFFPPNSDSLLIEIDLNLDQIVQVYTLPVRNPTGKIYKKTLFGDPHLLISCTAFTGFLSRNDGGIIAFHLPSRTFRPGFLYSEEVAGGDISSFQIKNESIGYASILDASFKKSIQIFQPSTGAKLGTLIEIPGNVGANLSGMFLTEDGKLIVGNTDFRSPGLIIYDTNQANLLLSPAPISVELTPLDIFQLQNSQ